MRTDADFVETGFAWLLAKLFLTLAVVMVVMISPPKPKEGVKPPANYIISMKWPGEMGCDVDLWVLMPDSNDPVGYTQTSVLNLSLERDDMGHNPTLLDDGHGNTIPIHEEIVSVHASDPGDYWINAKMYRLNDCAGKDVPISVEVTRINPTLGLVASYHGILQHEKQEITLGIFNLSKDGFRNVQPVIQRQFAGGS